MPNVINHYRTNDAVTVLEYDDGSKAYVHYIIPIDELGNVLTPTGGGGGGGAVTIADGADIAEGAKADTAATDTTSPWSAISLLKGVLAALRGTLAVTGTFWQTVQPVSGTFWQATQPVSVTSLPLPTGAAQDGTDATGVASPAGATGIRGWLSSIFNKLNTSIAVTGTFWQAVQPVSGTFWQATQPISATSLPLPTGASQDGTDGTGITPPTGAVGIRGWLSGIFDKLNTSIAVTGTFFQVTQPVSGTVTANAGTNLNTSALATETGNLAAAKTDLDTLAGIVSSGRAKATLYDVNGNVLLGDNTGTGTFINSGDIVGPVRVDGRTVLWVQLVPASSPTGQIRVQGSLDGTTFFDLYAYQATAVGTGGGPFLSLDATTAGRYVVPIGGLQKVQVKANTMATGTVAVTMNLGQGNLPYQPSIITGFKGRQASVNDNGAMAFSVVDAIQGTAAGVDPHSALAVVPRDANGVSHQLATGDGLAGTDLLAVAPMLWNGTTFDRGDDFIQVLPSAASTGTRVSSSLTTPKAKGLLFQFAVTARAGTTTLQLEIRTAGGAGLGTIGAGVSIGVGALMLVYYYPNLTPPGVGSNDQAVQVVGVPTPRDWFAVVFQGDANSITYDLKAWALY